MLQLLEGLERSEAAAARAPLAQTLQLFGGILTSEPVGS